MKLSESIWEELGSLAQHIELIDHDSGAVKFKGSVLQTDKDAVAAVIAAHNPLSDSSAQKEAKEQQQLRTETKALAMFKALEKASWADVNAWVDTNFSGMTVQQRAFLKMLAAGVALYLREK